MTFNSKSSEGQSVKFRRRRLILTSVKSVKSVAKNFYVSLSAPSRRRRLIFASVNRVISSVSPYLGFSVLKIRKINHKARGYFCAIPPQANKFRVFEIFVISVKKPLCFSVPRFLCVEKRAVGAGAEAALPLRIALSLPASVPLFSLC